METLRYRAFGLELESSFPLPGMWEVEDPCEPAVSIRLSRGVEIEQLWSEAEQQTIWETIFPDGCPYRLDRAGTGEYRFTYGDEAAFHLSANARTLLCAPTDPGSPIWQQVLLDSILSATSLIRGFEALHASAVDGPHGVIAFVSGTGAGKTSLAAELVSRGRPLFCDDVLALRAIDGELVAFPGPPVMNLPLSEAGIAPTDLGSVLAIFEDEAWIAVSNSARAPSPVAAICLLERGDGLATELEPVAVTSLNLLAHALGARAFPERTAGRFDFFGDLAVRVPTYHLRADLAAEPGTLADLIEGSLSEDPVSAGALR